MNEMQLDTEARHELDAEGRDAGVEFEDLGDDAIREPFDPQLIDVVTEVRSLDTLMKRLRNGQINLDADFQRLRGIWNDRQKSQLIESLLLRIPLPTFYVAEIGRDKAIGEDSWDVVDGIQRLSTIAQFVAPDILKMHPLRLRGVQYLRREEGKFFTELSPGLQLRVLESQFTIQVIRKTTPEAVKLNIFARLNTGGLPLSSQELRHALIPGQARQLLSALAASDTFQDAVAHSVNPSRMADREMVLRFLAFRMSDPLEYKEQDFDRFLRHAMGAVSNWNSSTLAERQAEFDLAMRTCSQIFGTHAFRKRYTVADTRRRPISKALFESVSIAVISTYDHHGEAGLNSLIDESATVNQRFFALMADPEFERAISLGTGDPAKVRYRFSKLIDLMNGVVEETAG
jgi:hypothetical protein